MREVVLDTETTGLDPGSGHRVVEIGCLELVNHVPTGTEYHCFLDPERDMPDEAFQIHGLSGEFLRGQKKFAEVADELAEFLEDSPLVIHNAAFDIKFLNAEFAMAGHPPIEMARAVDTMLMARQKFPGAPASLDALCKRFDIDLTVRDKHGALIDSQLLAAVYLELIGGRQADLALVADNRLETPVDTRPRDSRPPRPNLPGAQPTAEEIAAHEKFLERLTDPVWRQ